MRRKDREISEQSGIINILQKCKVCRIAMIDNDKPYIVPLNYGFTMDGNILTLYFHCAREGRKVDILKINSYVCFEIDYEGELFLIENPCNSGYYYESIIGYGNIEFETDDNIICEALTNIVKHQSGQFFEFTPEKASNVYVLKLVTTVYSGKKKVKTK
jgi:uncharacterized protein